MDQTGFANCRLSPDWEAMASLQPRCRLCLCSHGLCAAMEAERARITLSAHAAMAAERAKEEQARKKRRLKLVKNKKLEDKSKILWPVCEDEFGPIYIVERIVVQIPARKLNGDLWMEPVD